MQPRCRSASNVGLARKPFDRSGKVEMLKITNKRDDVALGAAAVTKVDTLFWIDTERWGFFAVEGTKTLVVLPNALQRNVFRSNRNKVGRRSDPSNVLFLDSHDFPPLQIRTGSYRQRTRKVPIVYRSVSLRAVTSLPPGANLTRYGHIARICCI